MADFATGFFEDELADIYSEFAEVDNPVTYAAPGDSAVAVENVIVEPVTLLDSLNDSDATTKDVYVCVQESQGLVVAHRGIFTHGSNSYRVHKIKAHDNVGERQYLCKPVSS